VNCHCNESRISRVHRRPEVALMQRLLNILSRRRSPSSAFFFSLYVAFFITPHLQPSHLARVTSFCSIMCACESDTREREERATMRLLCGASVLWRICLFVVVVALRSRVGFFSFSSLLFLPARARKKQDCAEAESLGRLHQVPLQRRRGCYHGNAVRW